MILKECESGCYVYLERNELKKLWSYFHQIAPDELCNIIRDDWEIGIHFDQCTVVCNTGVPSAPDSLMNEFKEILLNVINILFEKCHHREVTSIKFIRGIYF